MTINRKKKQKQALEIAKRGLIKSVKGTEEKKKSWKSKKIFCKSKKRFKKILNNI